MIHDADRGIGREDIQMDGLTMEAEIIFESHLPDALRRALDYAGDDGFVASMPQLLHARTNAADDNEIWAGWFFTTTSEETVATTKQGRHVLVAVHGGGIFASPERFRKLYRASADRSSEFGFTGLFSAKISHGEAHGVIDGKLPGGDEIPVYSYAEFNRGIADLPRRYAVIMDFETAMNSKAGTVAFDDLKDDPLMIVRAGGVEAAAAYLDRARDRNKSAVMGSWHYLNDIDPNQPQSRVLFLGGTEGGAKSEVLRNEQSRALGYVGIWGTHYRNPIDAEHGIRGDTAMINMARYVAVAPRNVSSNVRDIRFTN
jgi:hypothetical protein